MQSALPSLIAGFSASDFAIRFLTPDVNLILEQVRQSAPAVSDVTTSVQKSLYVHVVRDMTKGGKHHMADLIPKQRLAFGQFTLVSPLTSAECASRLAAMIQSPQSSLSGSARENRFRVAWRYEPKAVRVRNSFKPYLFGKLQRFEGGTIARCHFTLHPLVIGLLIYMAFMCVLTVVMLHNWTFVLVLLVILLAGVGVSWGERELLVYDVASAINAHTEAGGGSSPRREPQANGNSG